MIAFLSDQHHVLFRLLRERQRERFLFCEMAGAAARMRLVWMAL